MFGLARRSSLAVDVSCVVVVAEAEEVVFVVAVVVVEIYWEIEMRIDLRRMRRVDLEGESRWRRGGRNCRSVRTEN